MSNFTQKSREKDSNEPKNGHNLGEKDFQTLDIQDNFIKSVDYLDDIGKLLAKDEERLKTRKENLSSAIQSEPNAVRRAKLRLKLQSYEKRLAEIVARLETIKTHDLF